MGSATNPHTCVVCGSPLTATYIYTPRGWEHGVRWRCPMCDPTENPASATVPRADYDALVRERDEAVARAERAEKALRDARGTVPAFREAHREVEVIPGPFCPACLAIQCRADGHKSGIDAMRVVARAKDEALRFYADERHCQSLDHGDYTTPAKIKVDRGAKAREALGEAKS